MLALRIGWRALATLLFVPAGGWVETLEGAASPTPPSLPAPADRDVDFVEDIRPIFRHSCYRCHGERQQKGSFRLDLKSVALRGGDLGPAILPGRSLESPLLRYVAGLEEEMVMPAEGDRLTSRQVGLIRAWIDQGAPWPDGVDDAEPEDPRAWWSLRPLQRPDLPALDRQATAWARTPIDLFVRAKLEANGLNPAPEADRRTLIRRLYFDLLGLPPTPQAILAFERSRDPRAYQKLVDDLLHSPHYGERWARHWLDVVHYGDTHGYDKDKLRPHAWPYRDYVIRAFNEDKPYRRFVREQVAGDVLFPGTRDGVEALGFIAAGPWDFIGHAEVPETKIDGRIARHLDRDDMVANTINTFSSLTVQCAQCHQHKFDPISQEDYYGLQAVFAALDRTNKAYDRDPAVARRRQALERQQEEVIRHQAQLRARIAELGGESLATLEGRMQALATSKGEEQPAAFGYHSQIAADPSQEKWVQVDLGEARSIHKVILAPCHDDYNHIGAGFGFPVRYRIEASLKADFSGEVTCLADRTLQDVANPGIVPQRFPADGTPARYVRVTATRLAPRKDDYIFALAEMEVHDSRGENLARGAKVTALDSIEAPVRWTRKNLVDGLYPARRLGEPQTELAELRQEREALLGRVVPKTLRDEESRSGARLARIQAELEGLPAQSLVYAGAVHHGSGAFRGTGPDGGRPRTIHVLYRGDVENQGPEVQPSALGVLKDLNRHFKLEEGHEEGDRRAALAQWLTDRDNPLTWRSIVNRVWLYHFGRGIVDTPNDFGRMGERPTHPDLLDWLAVEFRDGGQSLKALHRLILNSATYRQASTLAPGPQRQQAEAVDSGNSLLWRMNRRRLEAEAVRDAVLLVSGKLDRRMYGPGFRDFVLEKPEHSPHYQYHLHDPDDPATHRRSIYRFIVRSQPQPFMTTLDCADPSMMVPKRTESLSALQALAMLNNGFILAMAKHFAARVERMPGELSDKVGQAFHEALGRPPQAGELDELVEYARLHGLENTCRLFFNLNEFTFVD